MHFYLMRDQIIRSDQKYAFLSVSDNFSLRYNVLLRDITTITETHNNLFGELSEEEQFKMAMARSLQDIGVSIHSRSPIKSPSSSEPLAPTRHQERKPLAPSRFNNSQLSGLRGGAPLCLTTNDTPPPRLSNSPLMSDMSREMRSSSRSRSRGASRTPTKRQSSPSIHSMYKQNSRQNISQKTLTFSDEEVKVKDSPVARKRRKRIVTPERPSRPKSARAKRGETKSPVKQSKILDHFPVTWQKSTKRTSDLADPRGRVSDLPMEEGQSSGQNDELLLDIASITYHDSAKPCPAKSSPAKSSSAKSSPAKRYFEGKSRRSTWHV